MHLYLLYRCPFGHRASIALREKRLPFEPVFFQRGQPPPELAAVGPYAKSPTLFDGDTRVWDAAIVLEYLEDRYPEVPLFPSDAGQRAQARLLGAQAMGEIGSKVGTCAVEIHYKPQKDEAKVAQATREFLDILPEWDQRLAGRQFVVGETLTVADITLYTLFPSMRGLTGTDVPAELAHLRGWLDRMAARPSAPLLEPGGSTRTL
jgi:glutathione S-transferase